MMKKIIKNITMLNTLSNLFLQFVTIISGFIIPKLILIYFGSEVNGLISSVNQLLSYITILEGGITGVVMASLYKPLINKDNKLVSSIIKTAEKFYRKIGIVFVIYTVIISIIYPVIFKTAFSYIYIFTLIIILSLNLLVQYNFSLSMKTLLQADKKVYVISLTQSIMLILGIVVAIISVIIYPNIHILKLLTGILFFIQPIIYKKYINKNYKLDKKVNINNEMIKNRWDGFAINLAAFVHNSTDIVILTIFTNLKVVSIYSVYSLITNGLKQIVMSVSNAITPSIGHLYASGNRKELNYKFDIFEYITFFMVFLLHSIAILLIVPFVMIYTKDISDTNYYQPLFAFLLVLSEAFYLIKIPHLNLAYSANKFKDITIPSYIEAVINIIISLTLIKKYGLVGIAIGTLFAMIYRMVFHISYTKKLINRTPKKFYLKLTVFSIASAFGMSVCITFFPLKEIVLTSWILCGCIYSVIMFIIYFFISIIFYKNELAYFKRRLFK